MIGIDIVALERFEHFLRRYEERALRRYLNDDEIALVTSDETAAGFFAAKEAIAKALGTGIGKECGFHDIRLHKDERGAPFFTLPEALVTRYAITESALSIAHDGGFAIAVASLLCSHVTKHPLSH